MASFFRDHAEFLRQCRRRFHSTGAVAPSSRFLADALTKPLRRRSRPARILEVGPGTGAVTRAIVQLLGPEDRLDLVELNPEFAALLRERFQKDKPFCLAAEQTRIFDCPLQDFDAVGQYDFIISGLPLNNFEADTVREIFEVYFRMLQPGGVLSYFEYMYVRPVRKVFAGRAERHRLSAIDAVSSGYLGDHRIGRDWVFINVPPAWVQHLQTARPGPDALAKPAAAWNTV